MGHVCSWLPFQAVDIVRPSRIEYPQAWCHLMLAISRGVSPEKRRHPLVGAITAV
jgi:hypothetical protein